ncbi:MAG: hotdog fold thioesterase [Bacteroidota bacterium]|jgi:1,4-dihydroxy-2-naphthoyl-CoA hydrolase|nr:hotdog fold thioesterase [Bacteroidota bacterium]
MNESIWHKPPVLTEINKLNQNTLGENLAIEFTEVGKDFLIATMPVNEKTKQPFGLLHGGANVALAETLGSVASLLVVNSEVFIGVGVEINANHIKAVLNGKVKGVCSPLNISGKNHVWDIKIYNELSELTCVSRFTCTIIPKNKFLG